MRNNRDERESNRKNPKSPLGLVAKLKMIQGPGRELNRLVEEKVRVLRHMAPNEWLRENEVVERYPVFMLKWLQAARCRGRCQRKRAGKPIR